MAKLKISSQAFYAAELRTERVRIFGVFGFLGVVAVVLTVRVFLLHSTLLNSHVGWNLTLAAALGLYEYVMLRVVDYALSANQEFPRILWISSTILETAVPAVGVVWLTTTGFESAYRPLASPATLLFFVFIILSILRLDPWVCRAELKFPGSPTIRLNGQDVAPLGTLTAAMSCRLYPGSTHVGVPPADLVRQAIARAPV
jgi:hypothetical protein